MNKIVEQIKGKLIVSCQALKDEPLHSSYIMSKMAIAAKEGGAAGIRANSVVDIVEIKKCVSLPVIGIIKEVYPDSDVYITPTLQEVEALVGCGCEIIAMDATNRPRPGGQSLDAVFAQAREKYPSQLFMADCSNYQEGMHAADIGFDFIGTTMCSYTPYTKGTPLPNYDLLKRLVADCKKPVIAEGGIWERDQLRKVMDCGVLCAVVGTAVSRPRDITRRFVEAIQ